MCDTYVDQRTCSQNRMMQNSPEIVTKQSLNDAVFPTNPTFSAYVTPLSAKLLKNFVNFKDI